MLIEFSGPKFAVMACVTSSVAFIQISMSS